MVDSLLLTAVRACTFRQEQMLTNASSFFFERDGRLFLVTSRHVIFDEPRNHRPDRIEIEIHVDPENIASSSGFSIPLYRDGKALWRQGVDAGGPVDVAVIEIERSALPAQIVLHAFKTWHLVIPPDHVEIGTSVLIVGFPLGFHDTLHHMPVVRRAVVASAFGLRFQGEGYFLTDARTHRGTSGAPVVMRVSEGATVQGDLPWRLLGVHSSRLDVGSRDLNLDEALGLNSAWYADILLKLTED
jgi:S1-C subfamily serine protease